jgi:hypothetical protein
VNRQQTVLSPSGRETSHIEQMTEIYAGKIAVIGAALGDVVSKNGKTVVAQATCHAGWLRAPFRNETAIYQDRLGTNIGKTQKNVFPQVPEELWPLVWRYGRSKKSEFFCPRLY